jgi:lysophospholipase L1-like esterase
VRPATAFSTLAFVAASFAALQGERTLLLEIDMELEGTSGSITRVYWSDDTRPLQECPDWVFEARPGRHVERVRVPSDLRVLRFVPAREPERRITLHRVAVRNYGVPLRSWGGTRGFADWSIAGDAAEEDARGGVLRFRSMGEGARVESEPLDLGRRRALLHLLLALALGAVLGLVHHRLYGALAAAEPARLPRGRWALADRGTLAVFMVSVAVCGAVLYAAQARLRTSIDRTPTPFTEGPYTFALYDLQGRPLTTRAAPLKLVLDPFSFYRNLPRQHTDHFTIDARGFRLGAPTHPDRPKAVVLGGSTAFGWGLDRDEDTFAARLDRVRPEWEWSNAGVIGFLSGNELATMVHYGDGLAPRLYVAFDGWNDYFGQLITSPAIDFGANAVTLFQVNDRLWQLAQREGVQGAAGATPTLEPAARRLRIEAAYVSNVDRMWAFARARGAQLLVVGQPHITGKRPLSDEEGHRLKSWNDFLRQMPGGWKNEEYAEFLDHVRAHCAKAGIPFLDLHNDGRLMQRPETLFIDSCHLNGRGHELVAERIGERLAELNFSMSD